MADKWTPIKEAADVTPEILSAAESIFDGWFADEARINWVDFLDRLDGIPLTDNSLLDLGDSAVSPAIMAIKRHVKAYAKAGN